VSRPKIKKYDPADVYKYAHLKRDGCWLELSEEGCITRRPSNLYDDLSNHPTVVEFFRRSAPQDRKPTLYCELFAPGSPQSEVKRHIANGHMGKLSIEAFASPDLAGGVPLELVKLHAAELGVPFVPWYDPSEVSSEAILAMTDSEGVVYKNGNLLDWAKYKAILTTDLVITGYKDGKGKYLGLIGALELSTYDGFGLTNEPMAYTVIGYCSGMDDATREQISDDCDQYLYRVVEVAFQYIGAGGGLRHPRFVRFRDDKKPEECTEI
jgi:hypothetical protein